jgi:HNH endonuclease
VSAARPELNRYAWQQLRAKAKARDGNRCTRCPATTKLQVHHVIRPVDGGSDDLDNLVTLCSRCHRLAHRTTNRHKGGWTTARTIPTLPARVAVSPRDPSLISSPSSSDVSQDPGDDPENGVYWAPPGPNGMHRRWSRPWFEWRDVPAFSR